jgi:hypothetical protein
MCALKSWIKVCVYIGLQKCASCKHAVKGAEFLKWPIINQLCCDMQNMSPLLDDNSHNENKQND